MKQQVEASRQRTLEQLRSRKSVLEATNCIDGVPAGKQGKRKMVEVDAEDTPVSSVLVNMRRLCPSAGTKTPTSRGATHHETPTKLSLGKCAKCVFFLVTGFVVTWRVIRAGTTGDATALDSAASPQQTTSQANSPSVKAPTRAAAAKTRSRAVRGKPQPAKELETAEEVKPTTVAAPAAKPTRVPVGVGCILLRRVGTSFEVLMGHRAGSHGAGTWALSGVRDIRIRPNRAHPGPCLQTPVMQASDDFAAIMMKY